MIRAAVRIASLLLLLAIMAPPHWLWKQAGRSPFPRWFLGCAGWICGARAHVTGDPIAAHSLLLANHVSWLDILVLAGATRDIDRASQRLEQQSIWNRRLPVAAAFHSPLVAAAQQPFQEALDGITIAPSLWRKSAWESCGSRKRNFVSSSNCTICPGRKLAEVSRKYPSIALNQPKTVLLSW